MLVDHSQPRFYAGAMARKDFARDRCREHDLRHLVDAVEGFPIRFCRQAKIYPGNKHKPASRFQPCQSGKNMLAGCGFVFSIDTGRGGKGWVHQYDGWLDCWIQPVMDRARIMAADGNTGK